MESLNAALDQDIVHILFYLMTGLVVMLGISIKIIVWLITRAFKKEMTAINTQVVSCNEKIQLQIIGLDRRIAKNEKSTNHAHDRLSDHVNELHTA